MLSNCGAGEDSWESLGQQRNQTSSILKEINPGYSLEGRMLNPSKALILWPPEVKSWLIAKDSDAGKDWRQEEKGTTEDKMVGWHNLFNGHEFEQSLGDCEGQGSLVCCSPWGCKELDVIERLNNNDQYSCLKNPMDRGAWRATVHRVAELDMTEWWACMHAFYIE